MHAYIDARMHKYMHAYIHAYMHTHIHAHTYMHTHIHIYIYWLLGASWAVFERRKPEKARRPNTLKKNMKINDLGLLGPSWAVLGPSWGPLGPSWGRLGGLLGRLGASGSGKRENPKILKKLENQ